MTEHGGLIGAALLPHSPRMAGMDDVPPFLSELAAGALRLGEKARATSPDVVVVQSAHWLTTFKWYTASQQEHEGRCVATEAPDLIPGMAYRRRGDPQFAKALVDALAGREVPAVHNDSPHYAWDYGLLVPLLRFDPESTLPVVPLSVCLSASLEECLRAGEALHEAGRRTGKRVFFVASGALSHKLVRVPEQWPQPDLQAMDEKFIALLHAGDFQAAREWLPRYARDSIAEVGGRHLATLLGALGGEYGGGENDGGYRGHHFGYAPSSGSGNANLLFLPSDTSQ